jgi:hypothetical protein
VGDQLIVVGPVVDGDYKRIRDALDANPRIGTVVLRHSPGGHAPTGYQVGAMLRERGLRTAVSGYCFSSCSRMFLGGKVRVFTDDDPPNRTNIGFHGHYNARGMLNAPYVRELGLKDWIIRYSDGKADPDLVERWINISSAKGMAHFFHPLRVMQNGASAFFCDGTDDRPVFSCEPILHTALDLGVITSLEVISSNDMIKAGTGGAR